MSLSVVGNRAAESNAEAKSPTEKAIDQFYKLVKESLGLLGGNDQSADVMKIDRGDLTRALNRNGRYLTVDHIMRLGQKLYERGNQEAASRLVVALVAPMDLTVYPRTQMTMAEMKARLLAMLRSCPNGELSIYQALGPSDPSVQMTDAVIVQRLKEKILEFPHGIGEEMLRKALATSAGGVA